MSAIPTRRRLGMAVATVMLAAGAAFATAPARAGAAAGLDALLAVPVGVDIGGGMHAGAPETTITGGPQDGETVGDVPPTFTFESSTPGATFECRTYDPAIPEALDPGRRFERCSSPHTRTDLTLAIALGEHSVFEVRAIDATGTADPTPAARSYQKHGTLGQKPAVTKCDPVIIKATHGKGILSNCRIVQIRNGTVPCVHVDTIKPTRCRFTHRSGRWLESTTGNRYALVGESVSPDGRGGGSYVVVAPVGNTRTSPCGKLPERQTLRRFDTAATASGMELATTCVRETMSASTNASGYPLQNFATREVCTSSHPHPDGATLTSNPAPGIYCYQGRGAGLNDVNGTERDERGTYLTESRHCHVALSGGYEIFVGKRPAVRNYPQPARVDPATPLVWRPVTNVRIAN